MISKRGLVAAAAGGTGAALLAAGTAFACQPGDFQQATVACDRAAGGQAAITVLDSDSSRRQATVSVYAAGTTTTTVPAQTTTGSAVTFHVPWVPGAGWDVHVSVPGVFGDVTVKTVTVPRAACAAAAGAAAKPVAAAKPTTASAVKPTTAPVVAPGTELAATGGGNDAGFIAILAGVMVAAGGGALYAVRRLPARRG